MGADSSLLDHSSANRATALACGILPLFAWSQRDQPRHCFRQVYSAALHRIITRPTAPLLWLASYCRSLLDHKGTNHATAFAWRSILFRCLSPDHNVTAVLARSIALLHLETQRDPTAPLLWLASYCRSLDYKETNHATAFARSIVLLHPFGNTTEPTTPLLSPGLLCCSIWKHNGTNRATALACVILPRSLLNHKGTNHATAFARSIPLPLAGSLDRAAALVWSIALPLAGSLDRVNAVAYVSVHPSANPTKS